MSAPSLSAIVITRGGTSGKRCAGEGGTIRSIAKQAGTGLLLVTLFLACRATTPSDVAVRCAQSVPAVSPASRTLSIAEAEAITTDLVVSEVFARLGPPKRDRCSGLYCPEWDVADGRVLLMRFASGCDKPQEVRLMKRPVG